jgi:hypothetical protein
VTFPLAGPARSRQRAVYAVSWSVSSTPFRAIPASMNSSACRCREIGERVFLSRNTIRSSDLDLPSWVSPHVLRLPRDRLLGTSTSPLPIGRTSKKESPGLSAPVLTRLVTARPGPPPQELSEPRAPHLFRPRYFRASGPLGEHQEKLIQARIGVSQVPFDYAKSPPLGPAQNHHALRAHAAGPTSRHD